ncbi:MAG: leucine-rich repeat protein [Firmicutes bacterium]|nr:leucine-rich repeat protein [Bacillota bacterium]
MTKYNISGHAVPAGRICLLVLLLLLLSAPAGHAAEITARGTCGPSASWTLTKDGVLTVSGTGEMEDFNAERDGNTYTWAGADKYPPWHDYLADIRKVVVRQGITKVSHGSFTFCNNLQEVQLPEGLTMLSSSAFAWCEQLESVQLPSSLKTIGFHVFERCSALKTITIPAGVESIYGNPFPYCISLQSITVEPSNGKYCSVDGVLYTKDLASLYAYPGGKSGAFTIPSYVQKIEQATAFIGCAGLTKLTVPATLEADGDYGYLICRGCTGLKEVVLPENLATIGPSMFSGCTSLEKVNIPRNTVTIGCQAFMDCSALKTLTLPEGLERIEDWAFVDCVSLRHMNLPSTLVSLGNLAFDGCRSWEDRVVVPAGIKELPEWTFADCSSLPEIRLPEGLTGIGKTVFWGCHSLAVINIPDTVQSIGENAFYECKSLTAVFIPSGVQKIEDWTFGNCSRLRVLGIPASVKSVGDYATGGCRDMDNIYYGGTRSSWAEMKIDTRNCLYEEYVHYGSDLKAIAAKYTPAGGFGDVYVKDYYADPVCWAVAQGVTNGTSAGLFSPDEDCTRGQIVTFLWRSRGCPEPAGLKNPFRDVKAGSYYYKAVLWAVENDITSGTGPDTFSPEESCTRGQVSAFLYRAAGLPAVSGKNPFRDVKAGSYYYKAVLWAVSKGITKGTSENSFSPDDRCTRGQIVTFLYRAEKQSGK